MVKKLLGSILLILAILGVPSHDQVIGWCGCLATVAFVWLVFERKNGS